MDPLYRWGKLRPKEVTSGPESHRDRKWEITIEVAKLPREEMTEGPKRVNLGRPSQIAVGPLQLTARLEH